MTYKEISAEAIMANADFQVKTCARQVRSNIWRLQTARNSGKEGKIRVIQTRLIEIRTKANHKSLFWSRCWNGVFNDEKTGKQSNNEVATQIIAVKS